MKPVKKGGPDTTLRKGILDGSILSARSDTGASVSAFKPSDPTISTGLCSNKSFGGAFGDLAQVTTINKLRQSLLIVPWEGYDGDLMALLIAHARAMLLGVYLLL